MNKKYIFVFVLIVALLCLCTVSALAAASDSTTTNPSNDLGKKVSYGSATGGYSDEAVPDAKGKYDHSKYEHNLASKIGDNANNWFQYNGVMDFTVQDSYTFDLVQGDKLKKVGEYTITHNSDNSFTITFNGRMEASNAKLSISNHMQFFKNKNDKGFNETYIWTTSPGQQQFSFSGASFTFKAPWVTDLENVNVYLNLGGFGGYEYEEEKTYTLTYNLNGGNCDDDADLVIIGNLPVGTYALDHVTGATHKKVDDKTVLFAGWSMIPYDILDWDDAMPLDTVTSVTITHDDMSIYADMTVYAVWRYAMQTDLGEVFPGQHYYTYGGMGFFIMIPDQWPDVQCGLIFDQHGATMTPQDEDDGTNLRELGNIYNYVVVNPEGPGRMAYPYMIDEPISDMIPLLIDMLDLDADRVHFTGFSMGGSTTWRFILTHSDIIASAAPAASGASSAWHSVFSEGNVPPENLQIPLLYIHGTKDTVVTYSSGLVQIDRVIAAWNMTGGYIGGDDTYRHYIYTNDYGTVFEYYLHDYSTNAPFGAGTAGGHCFPGGKAIYDPAIPTPTTPFGAQDDNVAFNWGEEVIRFFMDNPKIHAEAVAIDQSDVSLDIGDTLQLTATITPWNAADRRVTWSSSNERVAIVDANGLVTAVGNGEVTITATTIDGGYVASSTVSVGLFGDNIVPGQYLITLDGVRFYVMIPDQWPDVQCGLIIDQHGSTMTAQDEDDGTNMRELGNKYGYVVLNPEAPNGSPTSALMDEPTTNMILYLIDVLGVDPDRVHMTGFSMGGSMTWRFILNHSDILASAAPAASGANSAFHSTFAGSNVPPIQIPLLYIHGTKDTVVLYSNGLIQIERVLTTWDMTGGYIDGDDTYRHYIYTNDYGTVFEYYLHDYSTDAPFGAGTAGGHCFPGGKAIYDPANPAPTTPFGAQDDNVAFNWGEEVIRFFMDNPKIHAEAVAIDQSDVSLGIGDTLQLTATITPWNTADRRVAWSSSNEDVVTVDAGGLLTAVGIGEATITATTNDGGYEGSRDVSVTQYGEFTPGMHYLTYGGMGFFVMIPDQWPDEQCGLIVDIHGRTMTPQDEDDGTNLRELGNIYNYIVMNPEGPNNMVFPDEVDLPTIEMVLYLIDELGVDPNRVHVTGFSMGGAMTWRFVRDYPDIFASAAPAAAGANNPRVPTFLGDDVPSIHIPLLYMHGTRDTVVRYSDGLILIGNVLAEWGLTDGDLIAGDDTYRRYLYTNEYGAVFDYLEHDYYTNAPFLGMLAGGHCFPGGKAIYDPDNPALTTPFGAQGEVSFNWGEEVIQFFIAHPKIHAEDVEIDQSDVILGIGDTLQLTATITPWNTADQRITWSSSNERVATVDANGLVTAVSNGEVTITATATDGGYVASSAVSVGLFGDNIVPGQYLLTLDGVRFYVMIPDQWPDVQCGLIIDQHGSTMTAQDEDDGTNMRELGNKYGYVVLNPEAPNGSPTSALMDEPTTNMILYLIDVLGVDPDRVHMTGFSMGGSMTWRFILNHSDILASAAPAASGANSAFHSTFAGSNVPPIQIPLLYIHGTLDQVVLYSNGLIQIERVLTTWDMTGGYIDGDDTYRHYIYTNDYGTVFEYYLHDYSTDAPFGARTAGGHCFPGGKAIYDPANPAPTTPFGAQDDNVAFNWGEEVIRFFMDNPKIHAEDIAIDQSAVSLGIGDILQLTATITPWNAADRRVTWSSSNERVATVDTNGLVTAVSNGEVTITATTIDGGYVASSAVSVGLFGDNIVPGQYLLTLDGVRFYVMIPDQWPDVQCGLIIDQHGSTMTAQDEDDGTNMRELGNKYGYVVLNPEAPNGSPTSALMDEPTTNMILYLIDVLGVDPDRVHMTGFSMGGSMTWRFILNHSDILASAAPAASGANSAFHSTFAGSNVPPIQIPLLYVHGTLDRVVLYNNGLIQIDRVLTTWDMTGGYIDGDDTYRHYIYTNDYGTVFEYYLHDYSTNAPFGAGTAGGHCFPGGKAIYDPANPAPTTPFGAQDDNVAFNWGEEVIRFFMDNPKIHAEGVTIDQSDIALGIGDTLQLTATITPWNAADRRVTWSSSDEDVVTVDANGLLTATGIGEATITATTNDGGYEGSCDISVTQYGEFTPGLHYYTYGGMGFFVMIPDQWPDEQCGMIVDIHGMTMTPQQEDDGTNLRELGNQYGYIVVNPEGPGNAVYKATVDIPTIEMVLYLIDELDVDPDRVHVTGFSMGAWMTWRYLRDYPEIFASAAPASCISTGAETCSFIGNDVPPIQIPILYAHGTRDPIAAFNVHGLGYRDRIVSAWNMTGGLIGGDDTYRHSLYTNDYGTVFEFIDHDYYTNAPFASGVAGGHCFPGGKAVYDPENPAPTTQFGAQGEVSYNWGEEVIRFFIEHPKIRAADVEIDQGDVALNIGETLQMSVTITPWNAADKRVTWSSSNVSVATVDAGGLVTAVSNGEVTITATANDGGYVTSSKVSVNMFGDNIAPGQYTLTMGGIRFQVMIPDQWPDVQCGLIIDQHGATMTPQDEDDGTNMRELGNIYGYVVVNPEGPGRMPTVVTDKPTADMVYYLIDVLDLDEDRIHMTGFSMGGMMTWRFIRDYPDLLASAAPASSAASNALTCTFIGNDVPPIQIPVLFMYGTLDPWNINTNGRVQVNSVLAAWDLTGGLIGGDDTYRHYIYTNEYGTVFEYFEHDYYTNAPFTGAPGGLAGGHCFPGGKAVYDPENPITTPVRFGAQGEVSFNWGEEVIRFFMENPKIHAADVEIDQSDVVLDIGDTWQLTATISPWNAADKRVTWSSSNEDVATVDAGGLVTAVSNGEVTITATANDGGSVASAKVSVAMFGDNIAPGQYTLTMGGIRFQVMIPDQWPDVQCGLIIDQHGGTMTPQDEDDGTNLRELGNIYGYVVVNPEGPNGIPSPDAMDEPTVEMILCLIDVLDLDPDRVHMTGFSLGSYMTWRFIENHSDILASAAPAAAGVNSAWHSAFAEGHVPQIQIPLLYMHGTKDTVAQHINGVYQINRVLRGWNMTGEIIGGDDTYRHYLYTNEYGTVFEYFEHDYYTDAPFLGGTAGGHCFPGGKAVYDPENPALTTPFGAQGEVSFNWGEEVIRFFMENPKIHAADVEITQSNVALGIGDTMQLTTTISPWNAADKRVTWSSSNEDVATVDAGGLLTAVGTGEATITATTNDGGYQAYCDVSVALFGDNIAPGQYVIAMNGINFHVMIPDRWPDEQCGLIVDVHGGTMTPQQEDDGTNMRELGNIHGYVVLNPEGPGRMITPAIDEPTVAMIRLLVDDLNLDANRVHMTGFSMGGYMTWRFIRDYPDVLASAAPMSAAYGGNPSEPPSCTFIGDDVPPFQIPIIQLQGTKDPLITYESGIAQRDRVIDVWQMGGYLIAEDSTYRHYYYTNAEGTVFEFIEHDYSSNAPFAGGIIGGHCFPGGKTVYDPNNPVTPIPFGAQDDNVAFNWGEEVIRFFMENPKIHATDVEIDQSDVALGIGDTQQLTATITPWNAADKRVTWSSSNEDVATVDAGGLLTAAGIGEATITATANDGGYQAYCDVSVALSDDFTPGLHYLTYGGMGFFVMIPDQWPDVQCGLIVDMHGYTMTPQDEDDGTNMRELGNMYNYVVVNPEGPGRTVLPEVVDAPTAEMILYLVDVLDLDADRVHMTGFSMGGWMTWRFIRDYPDILASAAPASAGTSARACSFVGDDVPPIQIPILYTHGTLDSIVSYSSGMTLINAVIAEWDMTGELIGGDDTYRRYLYTNEYGTVFEYLEHDYYTDAPFAAFGGRAAAGHCFPGGKAVYDPENPAPTTPFGAQGDVSFNWGEEVIRFFMENPKIHAADVEIDQSDVALGIGDTMQLSATITPWNAADKRVTWSSSNEDVATVDAGGLLTAVGIGEATITSTTNDGGYQAYCDVSVSLFGDNIAPGQYVITMNGIRFFVMIPDQWPDVQCGLIVDQHGYTMTPQDEDDGTNMRELGNIYGYVVVNPEGPDKWVLPEVMDDPTVEMILCLVDALDLDANRVHMTGFSMGGSMTWRFVQNHSDILASAAPAASAATSAWHNAFSEGNVPPIEIPLLFMFGTKDSSYNGGLLQRDRVIAAWDMTGEIIDSDDTYRHYLYTNEYGTVFEYYEHDYSSSAPFLGGTVAGHCFPGGKAIYDPANPALTTPFGAQDENVAFNWGEEVIRFFMEHPKTVAPETYTVTFVNWDDEILDEQFVEHGSEAIAPEDPERTGYTFAGWNADFDCVTEDMIVKALYIINKYTVTFVDWNDRVLDEQFVSHGFAALAPANPVRTGFIFIGWDTDLECITQDMTITAMYKESKTVVTPSAFVDKLNGNKNNLTITVTETYSDGTTNKITKMFSISNNAADTYVVGPYKVYVDTKGNTQIRACYIVE